MDGPKENVMATLHTGNQNRFRFLTITCLLLLGLAAFPVTDAFAAPSETGDKCYDGRDNDRDGLIDGDDPDCEGAPPPEPSLEDRVAELEASVSALQALLAEVTRSVDPDTGADTLIFSGINIQLVNGTGVTGPAYTNPDPAELPNGAGNLIIGYNEPRNNGTDRRSGSHMLILGDRNNYTSYGGIIAGRFNQTIGPYSAVNGGYGNVAEGFFSTVVGEGNWAGGNYSSVSGGAYNTAEGHNSSVSGGYDNRAIGEESSVTGGYQNIASGWRSSVSGGVQAYASGDYSTASGALADAWEDYCWVGGTFVDC